MKLSIIIPTLNRTVELNALLQSIEKYVLNIEYEVIIVDQNPPGFLYDILNKFNAILNIKHHNVTFRGLSKAKNFGVTVASGELLSFPDDDCKIFADTYSKALETLKSKNVDIVFGRCVDSEGEDSVLRFKKTPYLLNKDNMLGGFVEATGVISKRIFEQGFFFDENMGAGCFHGSEEGYDWLYRILTGSSIKAFYSTEVIFYHPQVLLDKSSVQALKRVFTYRCGFAKLCFKHRFYFKYFKRAVLVSLSVPFYVLFNQKKARYYSAELLGLLAGVIIK